MQQKIVEVIRIGKREERNKRGNERKKKFIRIVCRKETKKRRNRKRKRRKE